MIRARRERCAVALFLSVLVVATPATGQLAPAPVRVAAAWTDSAAALRELATAHFRQQRYTAAAELAEAMLALRPDDAYVVELLASSRYLAGDADGALAAWNRIGGPISAHTRIESGGRTPASIVAASIDVRAGELVTVESLARARRRVAALPAVWRSRVDYRPVRAGVVEVDAVVAERPVLALSGTDLVAHGVRALADARFRVDVVSPLDGGELWLLEAGWRRNRHVLAAGVDVPQPFGFIGIWQMRVRERAFAYSVATIGGMVERRELQRTVSASVSEWSSGSVHWQLRAGADEWTDHGRFAGVGAELELRDRPDRVALRIAGDRSWSLARRGGFHALHVATAARSGSAISRPNEWLIHAGAKLAPTAAPRGVWPTAGTHTGADALLRAHPLFDRNGVAAADRLGPQLLYANLEVRRWLQRPAPFQVGIAAFVDAARRGPPSSLHRSRTALDAGTGIRLRLPALPGVIRADAAAGILDGATALSLGWSPAWPAW